MADPSCPRRSQSSCSNHRSHIPVQYSQRINSNVGELRCTCPPSYYPSTHGCASVVPSRALPHASLTASILPKSHAMPMTSNVYSTHNYSQYFPQHNFHRFRQGPLPNEHISHKRCRSTVIPSMSQRTLSPPKFQYAQFCHPTRHGRTGETPVEHTSILRCYPKHNSELFMAEYSPLERLRRYPISTAAWTLPSIEPFYSVVYMRGNKEYKKEDPTDGESTDAPQNVCVTTIGGNGKQRGRRSKSARAAGHGESSLYNFMGRSESHSTSCPQRRHKQGRGHSTQQSGWRGTTSSSSQPLTCENDVFVSGTNEDSNRPRRIPFTTEPSTTGQSETRTTDSSHVPTESLPSCCSKCRSCDGEGSGYSSSQTDEKSRSRARNKNGEECKVLRELQNLEGFLGLKNTPIGPSTGTECCSCCCCSGTGTCPGSGQYSCSGGLPSGPYTCANCCASPSCDANQGASNSTTPDASTQTPGSTSTTGGTGSQSSYQSDGVVKYNALSTNSPSMFTVPSVRGSTAQEMPLQSPGGMSNDNYITAPNAGALTGSPSQREDSRSGGRDRRYDYREMCRPCETYDVTNITMTAEPIYDPDCMQCADARFADRLCEKMDCACTPIIRTSPGGSISLIDTGAAPTLVMEDRDTVMNKRNKTSLFNYLERSKHKGRTLREDVMRWVRYKSQLCRSRMQSMKKKSDKPAKT
ncbi:hypothetical protein Q1695_007866 [Nippostrongylus brasiliensis]|nr:hypothetical protein Q1695_007866 [Nippostrongylus brasiliensis]